MASNLYAGILATQFVAGNLAVVRLGDGSEPLSSHGNSVYIDQYTTTGAFVSTVSVPNYGAHALVMSGSASSEGGISRSTDGRFLALAGYNIPLTNSASSLSSASATEVPRAVGVIDPAGLFTLAAGTTSQYGKNNMRSCATNGHGNYWAAGGNSGTCYLGGGPPATIQTNVPNTRVIQLWGGSLYFSTGSGTPGIWAIPGAPVNQTAAPALLLSAGAAASPCGFCFSPDGRTAYVADETLGGLGGVQRWDLAAGNWALSYVFTGLTNVGARGVTADFTGSRPVVYATTAESATNRLVCLTDTGLASVVTTLSTAGPSQIFRGVAFTPSASLAPEFIGFNLGTTNILLTWTSLVNRTYLLQYTGQLPSTNWITLTNVMGAGPTISVAAPVPPAGTNRFYRVVAR